MRRRHDQYGTHDDYRASAHEEDQPPRRGVGPNERGPDYGSGNERDVRTSRDGRAEFQGRDYERESYGGGYGHQHASRDVLPAGRKGEWMRAPGTREWRGQAGASGMDGLASERAFGTANNEQMSALATGDGAYRRWRQNQLNSHDTDYRDWRRRQAQRYDDNYARWKASRREWE